MYAIDVPDVCQSVCLSRGFTRLRWANTAERIEVMLGVKNLGDLVLDEGSRFPSRIRCGLRHAKPESCS